MLDRINYKEARKLLAKPKISKYRAKITEVTGIKFSSRREAERWIALRHLEDAGEISDLRRQVCFNLHVNGIKIGRYFADFVYMNKSGEKIVEDVKAARGKGQKRSATETALYRRSAAHLKAEYGIDIVTS